MRAIDREAALEYLKSLSPAAGQGGATGRFRLGLDRMACLLDALGHPERSYKVIHVAGTNGKGSTAALIAAILTAAGYSTGLYTSPHLVRYEERIRLDGRPIPGRRLVDIIRQLRPLVDECAPAGHARPSEFEVGTALMYRYFAAEGAEVVVQETGLGGRLDATNLVEQPLLSVITPISIDHSEYLGDTLAAVAGEKAGIIRAGVPVVSGEQPPAAAKVLEEFARRLGSPLVRVGREAACRPLAVEPGGSSFDYRGPYWVLEGLRLHLLGRHQIGNAAAAVAAVEALAAGGLPISHVAVRDGLAAARWPGRLELIPADPPVLLDGAHNPAGARVLAAALKDLWPERPIVLVLGVLADKDAAAMTAELVPAVGAVVATRPDSPRALVPEELAALVEGRGGPVEIEEEPLRAIDRARTLAGPGGLVCVAGSLYLVGQVRPALIPDRA